MAAAAVFLQSYDRALVKRKDAQRARSTPLNFGLHPDAVASPLCVFTARFSELALFPSVLLCLCAERHKFTD